MQYITVLFKPEMLEKITEELEPYNIGAHISHSYIHTFMYNLLSYNTYPFSHMQSSSLHRVRFRQCDSGTVNYQPARSNLITHAVL